MAVQVERGGEGRGVRGEGWMLDTSDEIGHGLTQITRNLVWWLAQEKPRT